MAPIAGMTIQDHKVVLVLYSTVTASLHKLAAGRKLAAIIIF